MCQFWAILYEKVLKYWIGPKYRGWTDDRHTHMGSDCSIWYDRHVTIVRETKAIL